MNKKLYKAVLICLPLAIACSDGDDLIPYFEKLPRQTEVEDIVWRQMLDMSGPSPQVEWVFPDQLNCGWKTEAGEWTGWSYDYGRHGGVKCVSGQTMSKHWIRIAWHSERRMHDHELVHELVHAFLWHRTNDGDFHHQHRFFMPDKRNVMIDGVQVSDYLKAKGF